MKQTAVEWLDLHLLGLISFDSEELREMYKERVQQAKEMEKKNTKDAYENGDRNGAERMYYNSDKDDKSAEQYYNETFNNK